VALVAVPVIAFSYLFGGQSSGHSGSYQEGHDYPPGVGDAMALLGKTPEQACDLAYTTKTAFDPNRDRGDYIAGCLDYIREHPPAHH
jgi:hypothetical protein